MNSRYIFVLLVFLGAGMLPSSSTAQDAASFKAEFLRHFNTSSRKFIALGEAMPANTYSWRPEEKAMSVELVYMHIARYNYNYLHTYLGADLPKGIDLDSMEEITGKDEVLEHLKNSADYVRKISGEMGEKELAQATRLYGRDVEGWGVMMQLITHMNEHLGQSIAYARMNDVTPPWSN
ncbi:MAG: DinB family protein [Rhodothermales bacterium]